MGCSAGIPKTKEGFKKISFNEKLDLNGNFDNLENNEINENIVDNHLSKHPDIKKSESSSNSNNLTTFDSALNSFNFNFKDYQGLSLNKFSSLKTRINTNINELFLFKDEFYFFNKERNFSDITQNDILNDVNFKQFKSKIDSLSTDYNKTKIKVDFDNANSIQPYQKIFPEYNFVLKLRLANENINKTDKSFKYEEFNLSYANSYTGTGDQSNNNDKCFLLIFYDILCSDSIKKIKEINNLIITQLNLFLIPIMNIFVDENDPLEAENNFLKISELDKIKNYVMTNQMNKNLVRLFGLNNVTKSKVILFNRNREAVYIHNEEIEFLNMKIIEYFSNINLPNPNKANKNNNISKILKEDFVIFFKKEISEKIKIFQNNFSLEIKYDKVKLNCKISKSSNKYSTNSSSDGVDYPININFKYNDKDKLIAEEVKINLANFFSKFNSKYFLNEVIEENNREDFLYVFNLIQSFIKNECDVLVDQFEISKEKSVKNIQFKERKNELIFKLKDDLKQYFSKIQSFFSDNFYTNPLISKLKLRYKIIPDKGTKVLGIENLIRIKKENLKDNFYRELNDELCEEFAILNFNSPNKKIIVVINPNFILKLQKEKNSNANSFQLLDNYISSLCNNTSKSKIELYMIIFGYNIKQCHILNLFTHPNMKIDSKFKKYFLSMDDIDNYRKLLFYIEDVNLIQMILDENSSVHSFIEIDQFFFQQENNNNKAQDFEIINTKEVSLPNSKNNYIDNLVKIFNSNRGSSLISKENFKVLKNSYIKIFKKIETNIKTKNIQHLSSLFAILYSKRMTFDKSYNIQESLYENVSVAIRCPDLYMDLFLIDKINKAKASSACLINLNVVMEKITFLYFSSYLMRSDFTNQNNFSYTSSIKCFMCGKIIEIDKHSFFYCAECNIRDKVQKFFCQECHSKSRNIKNENIMNILEDDEDFFEDFVLEKTVNKPHSLHNHNLIMIKLFNPVIKYDSVFYYQDLYKNYFSTFSTQNSKAQPESKLNKCIICDNYIYMDISERVYLILSQLNIFAKGITSLSLSMFICEDCFNRGEEYYLTCENKISKSNNLVILEILSHVTNN